MATTARTDRVLTLHPQGKNGVNIARDKYADMKKALLSVIPRRGDGVAFKDLPRLVSKRVDQRVFTADDSLPWYVITVKQDLEARGLIEQVAGRKPQHVRRCR